MPVETGQEAPDFTLKDQDGNDVTLSSFRGNQNVVIVFYPFTFTGVCEGELCSLRDDLSEFEAVKAQVLAISCDSRHAQKQWASSRASRSRCSATSGRTARSPARTACSTSSSAARTARRS